MVWVLFFNTSKLLALMSEMRPTAQLHYIEMHSGPIADLTVRTRNNIRSHRQTTMISHGYDDGEH